MHALLHTYTMHSRHLLELQHGQAYGAGAFFSAQNGDIADVRLKIGPQSVMWRTKPQWLLFYQVQQTSHGWYEMHDIVTIEADWLPETAPHMYQKQA